MIINIDNASGVTAHFIISQSENASFDKETFECINDIQKMDTKTKNVLFHVFDTSKILKQNIFLLNNNL